MSILEALFDKERKPIKFVCVENKEWNVLEVFDCIWNSIEIKRPFIWHETNDATLAMIHLLSKK